MGMKIIPKTPWRVTVKNADTKKSTYASRTLRYQQKSIFKSLKIIKFVKKIKLMGALKITVKNIDTYKQITLEKIDSISIKNLN